MTLIIGIILVSNLRKGEVPETKPRISKPGEDMQEKWYIRFSVKDQTSTAYTEEAGAPLAANGKEYFIGGIAVHPRYPGSDPRIPLIPFGTKIYLTKPITIQGQEYSTLTVMDTGDIYYGLWSGSPYWFDVYFGQSTYYNGKVAREYGTLPVDYYWYEEWK